MSFSRKELDDLKKHVDKTIIKFLGFSEHTLLVAAVNCLDNGYDYRKTRGKLSVILDEDQAKKFTEKLFDSFDDFKRSIRKSRSKRKYDENPTENKKIKQFTEKKVAENEKTVSDPVLAPSPGQLTAEKIREMMANAQKMINKRKSELNLVTSADQLANQEAIEKARKATELQSRIQNQFQTIGALAATAQLKPSALILDDQGRTIDANTGLPIQISQYKPTLKANIRAKKVEQFKKELNVKPAEDISDTVYFDDRVSHKVAARSKRGFKFHEAGKFESLGQRLRTKAQLEKLHSEIATAAKRTGIASAAKLATITPRPELRAGEIPDVEWWDFTILEGDSYDGIVEGTADGITGITNLIEHPTQMAPPGDNKEEVVLPVILTKKERKKLRRQTRLEDQKEQQEKIRLGLQPPPEPKVKMANLMRVLGSEAVQDPTKIEAHVRAQMAKRIKTHMETNEARKLTKEERRKKKINKIKEDVSCGVHVSIYRIQNLQNPSKKFKVEANASQLLMTGVVILYQDCNVVVVEGGPKQQKKFKHLMLNRIKWSEENIKKLNDEDSDNDEEKKKNKCSLVWEGVVKSRSFGDIKFKMCPTESLAREQFRKHRVEHYWDLAYSGAILETADEI